MLAMTHTTHWLTPVHLACAAFLAALLLILGLAGCEDTTTARGPVTTEQPLRIVTTIRPIELIVRDVIEPAVGDLVTVSLLMSADVSPHGFEPTPSQVASLQRADVIIHNGLGLDDWAVRDLPRRTRAICFADVLGDEHDHHHHHHHHDHDHSECDHDHGPIDEHLWLDVELVSAFAAMCAAEIGRQLTDAGHDDAHQRLQASLSDFLVRVRSLDEQFAQATSAYHGRRVVTHHNVFSRLTERYHLGDPIVLRPVEMLEPTPGDIRRAIDAIRKENLSFIFIEPQFSSAAAHRISEETNVELILIDPLGGKATSWIDLMQQLLDALEQGFAAESAT
jgi:zinc transport system substrate-binding protein